MQQQQQQQQQRKGCDIIQPLIVDKHGSCQGLDRGSRLPGTAQIQGNPRHFAGELQSGPRLIGCHSLQAVENRTLPPASAEEESKNMHPLTLFALTVVYEVTYITSSPPA